MTFFWDTDLGEFFFPGLEVNTVGALVLASAITALFAILYEGIKVSLIKFDFSMMKSVKFLLFFIFQVYSANARAKLAREHMAAVSCAPSESANLLVTDQATIQNSFTKRLYRLSNETSVFFCHNSIGYLVMLAVMGYSGWVFLAVIFGMGIGYFFFGHISMKINMESIQVRTTNLVCAQSCPENAVPSSRFRVINSIIYVQKIKF